MLRNSRRPAAALLSSVTTTCSSCNPHCPGDLICEWDQRCLGPPCTPDGKGGCGGTCVKPGVAAVTASHCAPWLSHCATVVTRFAPLPWQHARHFIVSPVLRRSLLVQAICMIVTRLLCWLVWLGFSRSPAARVCGCTGVQMCLIPPNRWMPCLKASSRTTCCVDGVITCAVHPFQFGLGFVMLRQCGGTSCGTVLAYLLSYQAWAVPNHRKQRVWDLCRSVLWR